MSLSQTEIKARMVELHNLRRLHTAQKARIQKLEAEVTFLKQENVELRSQNVLLAATVQDLRIQMEELRAIVFGKKRKKDEDHDLPPIEMKESQPRTPESYKRTVPRESEVTETKPHTIDACTHCHGTLRERTNVIYFEEDIPLPQKKVVIKHIIEKGYCPVCHTWSSAIPLPPSPVIFGGTIKRYITYLSVVCRQSYGQIQDILKHAHDFDVSQGEIAKILSREGERMRPAYERLKARIRGEPSVHLDETSWRLFIGDGFRRFGWTMVGGASADAIFTLGKTRGKGNAEDLLGDSNAVIVSDDYAVYRNLDNSHQLCCAHILRKLRDLATSGEIKNDTHDHCLATYTTFAQIYADIEKARLSSSPQFDYDYLHARLTLFAHEHPSDPVKLIRIKRQISERATNYLTCLLHPHVVSDNNAAERSLRHLVLKRKISFGSLNEKTAETLAILASVLLSYKRHGTLREYLLGV